MKQRKFLSKTTKKTKILKKTSEKDQILPNTTNAIEISKKKKNHNCNANKVICYNNNKKILYANIYIDPKTSASNYWQ